MDEYTPEAWEAVLGGYSLAECEDALRQVVTYQAFVAPSDIVRVAEQARREQATACYTCGKPGHFASDCPEGHAWTDCTECGRPGHPQRSEIGRDRTWFCRDCREPDWRTHLPRNDPRHRAPGEPLRRPVAAQSDRPVPPLINEPGDLRHMNVDQIARELAQLRQPPLPHEPSTPERDAALRELALRQVGAARARDRASQGARRE